jgi:tyramine---L-glutamate ligase
MSISQHVLVYEFLSAGALVAGVSAQEQAELQAQGTAMRDAMLADLCALPGVRVACVVGDASRPHVAGAEPLPARPDEPHAELLRRAAQEGASIWAVAPETAGALEALARAVPAARWLGCTPAAIGLAASKRATCRHLAARGIAVPQAPPHAPGAWVVKPDDGAGATDTRRHASLAAAQADMQQRRHRGLSCTLEPWIDGEALSLSLCCRDGEAQLLSINRQQIEVDASGTVHFLGVQAAAIALDGERGTRLAALAAEVSRALPGLRGFVGIDLVWHAQRGPVVIEVNPRLTTAYVGLSGRLGFNVARRLLAAAGGPPS